MEQYLYKDHKKLAYGYTTGSCAAAAAKAAVMMLLGKDLIRQVSLMTPKGFLLQLETEDITSGKNEVSCAIRKDAGDDPDVTDRALIYAAVSRISGSEIVIDGGAGVGRVTKPGLDQPVGAAAINSVPRRMILEAVRAVRDQFPEESNTGLKVIISIPDGIRLAEKTFNPKLGIVGGISVLGTTGIVEPMSDQALLDTICVEINVRKSEGYQILPMAPGNYGKAFMKESYGFALDTAVECSNFIGDALDMAIDLGFRKILLVGHIGKLVKVAGGIRNTHSQYGDHRMEILADLAEMFCQESLWEDLKQKILSCVSTDEAVRILKEERLDRQVLTEMTERIKKQMTNWAQARMENGTKSQVPDNMQNNMQNKIQIEIVVFSNQHGELGATKEAGKFMRQIQSLGKSCHEITEIERAEQNAAGQHAAE